MAGNLMCVFLKLVSIGGEIFLNFRRESPSFSYGCTPPPGGDDVCVKVFTVELRLRHVVYMCFILLAANQQRHYRLNRRRDGW